MQIYLRWPPLITTTQANRDEQVGGTSRGRAAGRNQTETDEWKTTEQIASLIGCFIVYSKHLHHGEKLTSHRPELANNNELAAGTAAKDRFIKVHLFQGWRREAWRWCLSKVTGSRG